MVARAACGDGRAWVSVARFIVGAVCETCPGSAAVDGVAGGAMRRGEDILVRTAGRHGELDAADADGDESADLEELAADGAAGGIGEIGRLQGEATGALDQDMFSISPRAVCWLSPQRFACQGQSRRSF